MKNLPTTKPEEMTSLFRSMRKGGVAFSGRLELSPSDYTGAVMPYINMNNAADMFSVFREFVDEAHEKLAKPLFDKHNNAMVATNGWYMLLCRIPKGMRKDAAKKAGFFTDKNLPYEWKRVVDFEEPTDYTLSNYNLMATIGKGEGMHGMLQAMAKYGMVYDSEDPYRKTLYLAIGEKQYCPIGLSKLVDALFLLGCEKVCLCEKAPYVGWRVSYGTPLHVFGIGGQYNAMAVQMPIRHFESSGVFVLPVEGKAA